MLGPADRPGPSSARSAEQAQACVSPLPGFGERASASASSSFAVGALLGGGPGGSAALTPLSRSPAAVGWAPVAMGAGGVPLVVGAPLGLPRNELLDYLHELQVGGRTLCGCLMRCCVGA